MSCQVSIFLENKLGSLEKVTAVLRESGINIRSMHLNHTANGCGILNLVVSNPEMASQRLNAKGMPSALREIVVVRMADNPGGLDELLKAIARAGVNFTNAYGRVVGNGNSALLVIDIEDIPEAREKLETMGLEIVPDAVVYGF